MSHAIVFNADDLGYSEWRDAGIFRAYHQGLVTAASLLVNGASAASAAKRAIEEGLDIGVHLNLTEGVPLCDRSLISLLLDDNSKLRYKTAFWKSCETASPEFYEQIIFETRAQLQEFRRLTGGISATHIDGHQHVHIAPGVASVLAPLFASEGILTTRITDENISALVWIPQNTRARWAERIDSARLSRAIYARHGIYASDCFLGQGCGGQYMSKSRLLTLVHRQLPLRKVTGLMSPMTAATTSSGTLQFNNMPTAECMVHPGGGVQGDVRDDAAAAGCGDGVADKFALSPDRQHECTVLCDSSLQAQLVGPEHRLIVCNWKQLYEYHARRYQASVIAVSVSKEECVRVLLVAIGLEASGNLITALRMRQHLVDSCNFHVTLVNANETTPTSVLETILRNKIQVVVGLHAFHAGRLLFPSSNPGSNKEKVDRFDEVNKVDGDTDVCKNNNAFDVGTCPIPVIIVAGGTDLNECASTTPQRKEIVRRSIRAASAVVVFNDALGRRGTSLVVGTSNNDTSKWHVVPQGVDVSNRSTPWLRSCLGLNTLGDMLILLPSGIRPVKDPLFLVPLFLAWRRAQQAEQRPQDRQQQLRSVRLVIIGAVRDQQLMDEVRQLLTERLRFEDGSEALCDAATHSVIYYPPVKREKLLAALSESDVVINTSKSEGMANVLLESMALGRPILARRNEGNIALVGINEDRGGLFDTAEQCIDAIKSGWCTVDSKQSSAAVISAQIHAASEFVTKHHSCNREANMYKDIVHSVLK